MNYWLEQCEPPRMRRAGIEWDVFISYRSLDRTWAIALYDMLTQCGYKVFLDQFVLVPGQGLETQLGENLERSASGVLVWSERTADSNWVKRELNAMVARQTGSENGPDPFYFVVAALDSKAPPGLTRGTLYLDFSDYPDGPMGVDIVRLTAGLQGKPLSSPAVGRMVSFERTIRDEPSELRTLAKVGRFGEILERIQSDAPAYTTSATIPSLAIDQLIRGKSYERAIEGAKAAMSRFPGSLRVRQLLGLALRRSGQIEEAAYQLSLLREKGHEDPETLGILAAVYADIWEDRMAQGDARGAKDALEQSRNLYRDAFRKVPTDTYVGINAASKSAMLGELDSARTVAQAVLARLGEMQTERGGAPSKDYWERATEPEALLIAGDYARALSLYHDARIAHQHEAGSIESTARQVGRLLAVLEVPADIRQALQEEFGLQLDSSGSAAKQASSGQP